MSMQVTISGTITDSTGLVGTIPPTVINVESPAQPPRNIVVTAVPSTIQPGQVSRITITYTADSPATVVLTASAGTIQAVSQVQGQAVFDFTAP